MRDDAMAHRSSVLASSSLWTAAVLFMLTMMTFGRRTTTATSSFPPPTAATAFGVGTRVPRATSKLSPVSLFGSQHNSVDSLGDEPAKGLSRPLFFRRVGLASVHSLLLLTSTTPFGSKVDATAAAAVTSDLPTQLATASALRSIQSSQKRLQSNAFSELVALHDYPAIQLALRAAPLSEIRKASRVILVQAAAAAAGVDGENNNNNDATKLSRQYTVFTQYLERMDSLALTASRGRKLDPTEWNASYTNTLTALAAFVETAAEQQQSAGMVLTPASIQ